jgi:hypothetical protein
MLLTNETKTTDCSINSKLLSNKFNKRLDTEESITLKPNEIRTAKSNIQKLSYDSTIIKDVKLKTYYGKKHFFNCVPFSRTAFNSTSNIFKSKNESTTQLSTDM